MIVRTRGGGNRESRMPSQFAQDYIPPPGQFGTWTGSYGSSVHPDRAVGIPAVLNAIWLVAETIGSVPVKVYRGTQADKRPAEASWQWTRLHKAPNDEQSPFDFWFDVAACVESRGNAYIQKVKALGEVLACYVIDPDIVQVKRRRSDNAKVFVVSGQDGQVELTTADVLHVRGPSLKGGDVGQTPIRVARDMISAGVAAHQHEAAFYRNHANLPYALRFPDAKTNEQAKQILSVWKNSHSGGNASGNPGVLSGGADIQVLGLTMEDAQFVEGRRLTVEDVARIFRLPRSVLNAEDQGDIEQETQRLLSFGIGPRLARITMALQADMDLFGDTDLYPEFDADQLIRLDAATKDQIYHQKVQDGRILVDEARAEDGRPPLPDGVGQIPQLTPVGGAPNPAAVAANGNGAAA